MFEFTMRITQGINASGQTMRPRWNLTLLPWSFGPSNPHHSISMFGRLRWQNAISNSHGATLITKKGTTEKHCNEKTLKNWIYKSIEFPWSKRPQHGAISTNFSSSKQANYYWNIINAARLQSLHLKVAIFDSNDCKHLSIKCAQNSEVHPQIYIILIRNHSSTARNDMSKPNKANRNALVFVCVFSTSNHTAKLEPSSRKASHKHQIPIKTRKCPLLTEFCF